MFIIGERVVKKCGVIKALSIDSFGKGANLMEQGLGNIRKIKVEKVYQISKKRQYEDCYFPCEGVLLSA